MGAMAWPEPYFKGLRAHWLTTNGDPEQETPFDETLPLAEIKATRD